MGRECSGAASLFASAVSSSTSKLMGSEDILMSSNQLWQARNSTAASLPRSAEDTVALLKGKYVVAKRAQIKCSSKKFPHGSSFNFCLNQEASTDF